MDKIINYNNHLKKRIIVISDIHGNINLFEELLNKVNFTEDDILIILGDFVQRGNHNIRILNKMMELSKQENIIILSGNHEYYLCSLLKPKFLERLEYHLEKIDYGCLIKEWIDFSNIENKNYRFIQSEINKLYKNEINFLKTLPLVVRMDDYIFVHGGIDNTKKIENIDKGKLLAFAEFYNIGHNRSETVVVGHWPTQNYKKSSLSGNVIIDEDKKIISIDGGAGVLETGQLNAFILEYDDTYTYTYKIETVDSFRDVFVIRNVPSYNNNIVKLGYDDKEYILLERREDFSLCEKISTGEDFLLKNEFIIFEDNKYKLYADYISLFLSPKKGETIKLINTYGKYSFIKYKGEIGWVESKYLDL